MASTEAAPASGTWQEDATQHHYDHQLRLAWRKRFGDRKDGLLGGAQVRDLDQVQKIRLAVTGNDFMLVSGGGGHANYRSREASDAADRPCLIVNGRDAYAASRDTFLHESTSRPLGAEARLEDSAAILIAFDDYRPQPGDTAELVLTSYSQYGSHELRAYRPDPHQVIPDVPTAAPGVEVATFTGADFTQRSNMEITGETVTGHIEGSALTYLNQVFRLPAAEEYFLTVVIKLHEDWPDQGGKLPGLANTGQASNTSGLPLSMNGFNCSNSGWGGRTANGCRWSARTQWSGRRGGQVGWGSYFYAVSPEAGWGYTQYFPTPLPVGKWFAYVQRVRVNQPGEADGVLSYWLCTTAGCLPQYHRGDIVYRNADVDEALITEAWANIFCGGSACGAKPWPRSTASLRRMAVGTGMPDLDRLYEEVRALNP